MDRAPSCGGGRKHKRCRTDVDHGKEKVKTLIHSHAVHLVITQKRKCHFDPVITS